LRVATFYDLPGNLHLTSGYGFNDSPHGRNFCGAQAAQRLRAAREVFIHGYSMPASDLKARELLFGNINPDATIKLHCRSTSDRIADEFRSRGFARVQAFPEMGSAVLAFAVIVLGS
jgi:hypothetical protein